MFPPPDGVGDCFGLVGLGVGAPGIPLVKISFKMSPRAPPLSGAGCGVGDGEARPEPLRIKPEIKMPTMTGSSFFRMVEVTPESCCA